MKGLKSLLALTPVCIILGACQGTKHLPENEKLYTGSSIKIEAPLLSAREKNTVKGELTGLIRPKPNSKFLGMRPKLAIYNAFRNKKPNSFFGKIRDKYGEPPVLFSQVDLQKTSTLLQSQLENKGWFHAKVGGDTSVGRKTASAVYTAETRDRYTIAAVFFPTDSNELADSIRLLAERSLLKKGDPFDLDVIKAERIRIDGLLKERGFYFFSPEYILVKTDSTVGNHQVNLHVTVKTETPSNAAVVYRIGNVYIYSGYNLNASRLDTNKVNGKEYEGYTIIDRRERFKPKLFKESMQFHPGEIYNRTDHNQTLNRLINLNLFKFVKNRFERINSDTPKLDAYYYLTPLPGKTIRAEFTAVNRSNNLNGGQINFTHTNRNVFRTGSQLTFNAYIGSDVQFSGALRGSNTYRFGAEATYSLPRFWIPFFTYDPKSPYAPRTNFKIGYDVLNRKQLYTLNSYRFEYGYNWKKNIQKFHELYPISISYVQPLKITQRYKDLQAGIFGLDRAVEEQFILGSRYSYTYNQLANNLQPRNAFFFNPTIDISGNIAGLITGANIKKGDSVLIGTVPFAQYAKIEVDGRYYRRIGLKSTWANRIDIGIGLPYGNSLELPYVKQFFIGGNNSLRGFRSRSLGPGTYRATSADNLIPDQTGDIKLELNTELRPHISGPIYGALFLEAGNIWLRNDSVYTKKSGAKFTKDFYKQLAVDAGAGIRVDVTILVIRFDVAFPLRKPWESNPWVMSQIRFNERAWRQENIVFNLAIGYPF